MVVHMAREKESAKCPSFLTILPHKPAQAYHHFTAEGYQPTPPHSILSHNQRQQQSKQTKHNPSTSKPSQASPTTSLPHIHKPPTESNQIRRAKELRKTDEAGTTSDDQAPTTTTREQANRQRKEEQKGPTGARKAPRPPHCQRHQPGHHCHPQPNPTRS